MKRLLFLPALFALLLLLMTVTRASTALSPIPTPTPSTPEGTSDTSQVEQSILSAIAAHQEQVLGFLVYRIKVGNIRFSGDHSWATAWLGMVDTQTGGDLPIEPGLALVQREGESWRVTLQSDPDWLQVINTVPKDLMGDEAKTTWQSEYEQQLVSLPQPSAPLKGYLLPWAKGELRYLSQSVAHDAYTPNGAAHFAFDFYLHEQLWRIYAAKAGTVWKFYDEVPTCYLNHCDQPLGNYIVLKDDTTIPTTYQLYLHLAYHSIPPALRTIGAQVVQGQFVGIADNTGQSWGDHLHFQVHTNPNSYWGSSIDITFDDVVMNGGRPRVRAYDPPYCRSSDICYSYSDTYISGNTVKGDITLPYGDLTGL
ncbi:MAG: M23 family metallopeptidase, partial [Omnitrophica WOR_2 bacterium]